MGRRKNGTETALYPSLGLDTKCVLCAPSPRVQLLIWETGHTDLLDRFKIESGDFDLCVYW